MVKQKHPHYDQSYYRKFDGINFRLVAVRKKKTDANQIAQISRRTGYKARIVKVKDGYAVYKKAK